MNGTNIYDLKKGEGFDEDLMSNDDGFEEPRMLAALKDAGKSLAAQNISFPSVSQADATQDSARLL